MSSQRCEDVRELLPELALGILGGEERARVLDHVAICPRCERIVADLSPVADELLLLSPQREPPVGFERRVIARVRRERPRRRARRIAAVLAVAAVAAALSAGGMYVATRNDRSLAQGYVRSLIEAGGKEFRAAKLLTREGNLVGQVFAYEGSPSWVYVIAGPPASDGRYRVVGIEASGALVDLGKMSVKAGKADWAQTTTAKLSSLRVVRLVSEDGKVALEARFHRS